MNAFEYVSAQTPQQAADLVGKNGRYLAGGIDLLAEMKDYIVSPDVLVNVKAIPSETGGQTLGATLTIAEIAANADFQKTFPGLCEAAAEVGSPQIRNVATLGGNLLQHSRCWYYRQPDITCLKRGGETCYAHEGENKYLSLFSGCACISPVVSNLSVILSALDAAVAVRRDGKLQKWTMAELYHGAWKNPHAHNSLHPSDFLESVTLPLERTRSAYRQISEKSEFDWALVSCAAAANVRDGKIYQARVALGAIAPVPHLVPEAHDYLEGKPLNEETASHAASLILRDAKPLAQNGYKIPLAHTLIRRTLLALNA